MVAVDLRRCLQQEHCSEKEDVQAHFAKLRTMQEDLATMGHTPDSDDFYVIILELLPSSFEPFISTLNATSSVLGTVLSPDELMQAFADEYDRRSLGKTSKKEENAAFSAAEGGWKKGKGKKKGKCNNCSKPGHWARDCWEEGGRKEGQKPNWKEKGKKDKQDGSSKEKEKPKLKDTAKAEEDAAWMALCLSDLEDDSEDPWTSILSSDINLNDFLQNDKDEEAGTADVLVKGETEKILTG